MNPCYSCWANETVEYQLLFIHKINAQLQLDLNKHNDQYPPIEARTYKSSHDRFLIIDNTEVYHIGASLKDLGKKMFAFSKLELPAHTIIDVLWNKLITHARSGREYKIQDGNWRIGSIPRTVTRDFTSLKHLRQWQKRNDIDGSLYCFAHREYLLNEKGEWEQFTVIGKQVVTIGELERLLLAMKQRGSTNTAVRNMKN